MISARSVTVNVYIQNVYDDTVKELTQKVFEEATKSMKLQGVY